MMFAHDPRLDEAKAIPIQEIVDRLGIAGLKRVSSELIGPCPLCGGRDRFGINLRTHLFQCRRCDLKGGDQVALVQGVQGIDFRAALTWCCGEQQGWVDPEQQRIARERAAADQAKRDADQEKYRRWAIKNARSMWKRADGQPIDLIRSYLRARGISESMLPQLPRVLRLLPDHPYVKNKQTLHRGPCMLAQIWKLDRRHWATHQTWIDATPPHGKAKIVVDGDVKPSKLVMGSKKGGFIPLFTPKSPDVLVMGEGIETTLTAMVAQPFDNAAYWAGVDLGNMAGRALTGKGMKFAGQPDLSDTDSFLPPEWVKTLVYIMDGDSEPRMTRHKLECGLRRAMARRPGLRGQIVQAGQGVDLNDVLMGATHD